jgi:hypothetical protein
MQKKPHRTGTCWAMWWGMSLGLAFLAAATASFATTEIVPRAASQYLASPLR